MEVIKNSKLIKPILAFGLLFLFTYGAETVIFPFSAFLIAYCSAPILLAQAIRHDDQKYIYLSALAGVLLATYLAMKQLFPEI